MIYCEKPYWQMYLMIFYQEAYQICDMERGFEFLDKELKPKNPYTR